ncbi:MAG: response regulator transcription factor [Chloroflexota bacterium]
MTDDPIRIIIADDNAKVRFALKVFIELYEDFQLIGEACDGSQAVELCQELQPDLVLMDLIMPQMDGVAATGIICERFPNTKILVLTSSIDYELITKAMNAGADGYLFKHVTIDVLEEAIRSTVS